MTPSREASVERIIARLKASQANVDFSDLLKLCIHYFGQPRNKGTSHMIFKTPWPGDPRVNIQNDHGKAKVYQVRQVLQAIAKLEGEN